MRTRLQRGGILKLVAALTMAAILSLDGWTIPKPQELAGTKVAYAEEAQGEMLASQADELDDAESVADDQGQIEPEAAAPVEEAVTQEAPEEALGTQDDDPHVYLDQDNGIIYSDGNLTLTYDASEVPADDDTYFVDVELGVFRDDVNGSPGFDPDFTDNENAYSFDADTNTIVLHGAWLYENYFKDHQDERLRVSVWLYHGTDDEGNPIQVHPSNPETGYYNVREAKIDYHPMWSGDMLPGWDGFIDKYNSAWVENTDNPDGMDVPYEVTNVEIITGEDSFTLEKQENGWYFRAEENLGSAVFEVTHTTIDDETTSYQFTRNVTGSVYDIEWDLVGNTSLEESHNGLGCGLPGDTIELLARGIHHHAEGEDTYDGFTYAWSFIEGDEYASIDVQQNSDGSSTASVTFNNYEGSDYYCGNVRLHVVASKNGNDVSSGDIWLDVENEYPSVWVQETGATTIEGDMLVGTTQEVTPKVRYYTQGSDGYTLGDIEGLTWDFDSNCVSMSYGDGVAVESGTRIEVGSSNVPTFTITRLGDWDSDINLSVDWRPNENQGTFAADGEGLRHEHARWRLNRSDVRLWFDGEHDIDVWVTESEGAFSNPANVTNSVELSEQLAAVEGVSVEWTVGTWEDGEYLETFGPESGLYSVSADGLSVTSNATAMAERGIRDLRVTATAKLGDAVVRESDNDFWFHLQTRETDYDRERDRSLLPHWDGSVQGSYRVWVRDEDHPDGEDFDYEVTGVRVVDGEGYLEDFHEDSDGTNTWWYYRAGGEYGTATLEVTYKDLDGTEQSYTFDLNVVSDVYDVRVWSDDMGDSVLPGSSSEIRASAVHHRDGQDDTAEGLSFRWEILEGADVGSIDVDPDDSSRATFTASSPSQERMGFDDFVHVRAYLYDGENGPVADSGWAFFVRNAFTEVWPWSIDGGLNVGDSQDLDLELRSYLWDSGEPPYETIDDAEFYLWYDPERVSIADAEGNELVDNGSLPEGSEEVSYPAGSYTLTRLSAEDADINVRAVWEEDGERRECWRSYRLDWLDYGMWFTDGEHDIDVWVTESEGAFSNPANVTNSVELSEQLAAVEGVSVEWTVGTWEDGEYLETFGPESGLYSVSADGLSVTSNATAMAERGIRDLRVTATAKLGDAVVRESDNDFWFHLQTRICSYGFPNEANMLPGWVWGGWIPGEVDVFLLDEDHDHEHATATVTSVSVVNPSVANVRKEGDRWTLEALEHGETTAIIKFVDYDGQTKGWALPIVVSDKVYNVEVWTSPQSGVVLPGQSVEVYAKGWVECEDAPTIYEGLSYRWEPESGEDFTLTVDEADPTHATVTFRDLNENENPGWYYCEAWPNVVIYETDDQGNEIDRARAFTQVSARSSSYVLDSEEEIDPNLAVNGTATADPKVTRVFVNDAGEVVSEPLAADDLQFFWSYDPEAVRLTDASGAEVTNNNWGQNGNDVAAGDGPYTVTRLREYGTSLEVMARWSENGEEFSEWLQFMLLPVSPEAPKIDISQAAIAAIPAQTYTGRAIEPALTVTYDGATLVAGNDYTVTYRDNVNVGNKAKVTVTGTGDFTGTASATFRIGFKDVKKGAWYYNVVYRANDLGLIGGYSGPKEGTFGPNDNIQRGQVAIILWNLARKPAAGSGAKDFSDVKKGAYYYSAVRWASSVGVVSGGSDGTFRPTDNVTREELASMLRSYYVKVAGKTAVGSAADFASMPDAGSVSSWARNAVGFCFRNKILSGKNGMIAPKATATRAETAKMVVNLYDMLNA